MVEEITTTTIRVGLLTKHNLDQLKVHPKQPYDELLNKLMESYRKEKEVQENESNGAKLQ